MNAKIDINAKRKEIFISLFILLCVTFLSYSSVLNNDFLIWDDQKFILKNPLVHSVDLQNIVNIFKDVTHTSYVPLTVLTFAVEYHFFRFDPFFYHLNNLILHILVTGLVFLFCLQLHLTTRAAFFSAFIFALHPMHVESVAWVTERKDVLYASFYMLSLCCYCGYIKRSSSAFYFLSLFFGFLSILAKPMALSLPLIILLCDWLNARRLSFRIFVEKIPYLLYILPISWITYSLHSRIPPTDLYKGGLIWFWTLTFYIQKFFLPFKLNPLYQLPQPVSINHIPYILSLFIILLCIYLCIRFRKNRWFVFAGLFYLFSIFFLLKFDNSDVSIVADRYMYLPSLGFCLLIGVVSDQFIKIYIKRNVLLHISRWMFCLFCLLLMVKIFYQGNVWQNGISLWTEAINRHPQLGVYYYNRGGAYEQNNKYRLALKDYNRAIELNKKGIHVYNNRGTVYAALGRHKLAIEDFNKALEMDPQYAEAYVNRGFSLKVMQRYDLALADFETALSINPLLDEAYLNMGFIYKLKGQHNLALSNYNRALQVNPYLEEGYNNRGNILNVMGQYGLALKDYNTALSLNPRYAEVYNNRGVLYQLQRKNRLALKDFDSATQINPAYINAIFNKGVAYASLKDHSSALNNFNQVIQQDQQYTKAYFQRALVYINLSKLSKALADYNLVISYNPNESGAYYNRSMLYRSLKNYKSAFEDAKRAKTLGYNVSRNYLDQLEKLSQRQR